MKIRIVGEIKERIQEMNREEEDQELKELDMMDPVDDEDDDECEECYGEVRAFARLTLMEILNHAGTSRAKLNKLYPVLDSIWGYQEEGEYDMAYDLLMVTALVMELDSRELVLKYVCQCDIRRKYFMDYLCEYLIDDLMFDRILGGDCDECECDCDM